MAQDIASLREERDKLGDRSLFQDGLAFHTEKLMAVSDAGSGRDLRIAVNKLRRLIC